MITVDLSNQRHHYLFTSAECSSSLLSSHPSVSLTSVPESPPSPENAAVGDFNFLSDVNVSDLTIPGYQDPSTWPMAGEKDEKDFNDLMDVKLPECEVDSWFKDDNLPHQDSYDPYWTESGCLPDTRGSNNPSPLPRLNLQLPADKVERSGKTDRAASAAMALARAAQRAAKISSPTDRDYALNVPPFSPVSLEQITSKGRGKLERRNSGYVGTSMAEPSTSGAITTANEKLNFPIFSKVTAAAEKNTANTPFLRGLAPAGSLRRQSSSPNFGSTNTDLMRYRDSEGMAEPDRAMLLRRASIESSMVSSFGAPESHRLKTEDCSQPAGKRSRCGDDSESLNPEDGNDDSMNTKKEMPHSERRSKAASIHNLSERRRRDRINERMKHLQELIPNSNKTDKASILDEAIEYIKMMQMQMQVMSMRSGMSVSSFIPGPQSTQMSFSMGSGLTAMASPAPSPVPPPHMGMGVGMGVGIGVGMGFGYGMGLGMGVGVSGGMGDGAWDGGFDPLDPASRFPPQNSSFDYGFSQRNVVDAAQQPMLQRQMSSRHGGSNAMDPLAFYMARQQQRVQQLRMQQQLQQQPQLQQLQVDEDQQPLQMHSQQPLSDPSEYRVYKRDQLQQRCSKKPRR